MNSFSFFVGGILPYVAVVVFIVGMVYRLRVWAKTPQPGKMTLFGVGGEDGLAKGVIAEALFFPSLFKGDRLLWTFAWIFHAMLALVILGHLRVFSGIFDSTLLAMGVSEEGIGAMSATLGGGAGILLVFTGLFLLFRRLGQARIREISGFPDFFALLLLLSIFVTGDIMRFGAHFDLQQTRVWASSLLTFSPIVPENNMFLLHAMLAQFLFIYVPFSKIMHFGGIFFTQALVKRR